MCADEAPRFELAYYHKNDKNVILEDLFRMLREGSDEEKVASGPIAAAIRDLQYFIPRLERPYRFVDKCPVWLRESDQFRYSIYFSAEDRLVGIIHFSWWWPKSRMQCRRDDWEIVVARMKRWSIAWKQSA